MCSVYVCGKWSEICAGRDDAESFVKMRDAESQ